MMASKYMLSIPPESGKGRPHLVLSEEGKKIVEMLAKYMCTEEEIASELGTTCDTLHNRNNNAIFSECIKRGQHHGKVSLRRTQFKLAEKHAGMAIFLGKQYLDQKDEPERAPADEHGLTINYDYGGDGDDQ